MTVSVLVDTFEFLTNLLLFCLAILNPYFVVYQVDDLQDKYHECLEMLMENQVK